MHTNPDERLPSFIFKQIEENYGRIVLQEARKLVSVFITIEKQFSHLRFNLACKTNGILPKSLQLSPPSRAHKGYRLANRFGWQFFEPEDFRMPLPYFKS